MAMNRKYFSAMGSVSEETTKALNLAFLKIKKFAFHSI